MTVSDFPADVPEPPPPPELPPPIRVSWPATSFGDDFVTYLVQRNVAPPSWANVAALSDESTTSFLDSEPVIGDPPTYRVLALYFEDGVEKWQSLDATSASSQVTGQ
jgi:hypothetical protein